MAGAGLRLSETVHGPFETGHRIDDRIVIDAEGDAEMTGPVETAARNDQDQFLLQRLNELNIVGDGGSWER